mmetsp:Transcript_24760/g.80954  ORF Transcript_24760/g.80954 Transcript_24760/m.80954 type:complete len:222 (-) Transcript_24760:679-1344(-)
MWSHRHSGVREDREVNLADANDEMVVGEGDALLLKGAELVERVADVDERRFERAMHRGLDRAALELDRELAHGPEQALVRHHPNLQPAEDVRLLLAQAQHLHQFLERVLPEAFDVGVDLELHETEEERGVHEPQHRQLSLHQPNVRARKQSKRVGVHLQSPREHVRLEKAVVRLRVEEDEKEGEETPHDKHRLDRDCRPHRLAALPPGELLLVRRGNPEDR